MAHDPDSFEASATLVLGITPQGDFVRQVYLDPHPDEKPGDEPVPLTHNILVLVVTKVVEELHRHLDVADQYKALPRVEELRRFTDADGRPWLRIKLNTAGECITLPYNPENGHDAV